MKTIKTFLLSAVVLSGLASCVSETLDEAVKSSGTGYMSLNVNILEPNATRATKEVKDFPVTVKGTDVTYEKKYDAVSEIPASVKLAVGNYTVESHTPGVIQKRMSAPYYKGIQSMEILKGITANVEVTCKMQNSSIKVNYSDDFRDVFSSWTVTLDDGSETALDFNQNSGTAPIYWYFGENGVEKIAVTFRGVTKEGSTISQKYELTKDDEYEGYDDTDNKNFTGGDAIVLNLTPTEATTGKVTGLNITANVTFSETGETVKVYVSDKQQFPEGGEDDEPGGEEPGGEENGPSFECVYLEEGNPGVKYAIDDGTFPVTDVTINTPAGIESLKITIIGGNEGFDSACQKDMGFVDYELIGEGGVALASTLQALGNDISFPAKGAKTYTFPVGSFYSLMNIYGPTVNGEEGDDRNESYGENYNLFKMTVVDKKGNSASADLKVTITKEKN